MTAQLDLHQFKYNDYPLLLIFVRWTPLCDKVQLLVSWRQYKFKYNHVNQLICKYPVELGVAPGDNTKLKYNCVNQLAHKYPVELGVAPGNNTKFKYNYMYVNQLTRKYPVELGVAPGDNTKFKYNCVNQLTRKYPVELGVAPGDNTNLNWLDDCLSGLISTITSHQPLSEVFCNTIIQ